MVEPEGPRSKHFRFSDPRQERIYRRLRLIGPGPASFFQDACGLMAHESLNSTAHVVSHLLREIESAIRDVLEPREKGPAQSRKDDSYRSEIQSILRALDIADTDPIAQAWLKLPGKKNDYGLYARAHREALGLRRVDSEFRTFWDEIQRVLDAVLEHFEERYLSFHSRVDQLLSKEAPTQEDAKTLRNQIPNSLAALGYFFDKAPLAWLKPLRDKGFFTSPPGPEYDPRTSTTTVQPWPESRYLARVAAQDPKGVLDITLSLPDTANVFVHLDLAGAALQMPPALAAKLVPKAKSWIGPQHYPLLPGKLADLIAHLAKGGQVDAALDLAKELLAVTSPETETARSRNEVRSHLRDWGYKEILERCVPSLVQAADQGAVHLLCDLLDEAVSIQNRSTAVQKPRDFSHIWRPAVEEDTPGQPRGIKDALVSAIRIAVEQIAEADPSKVDQLVGILEERPWRIFHRIALFILSRFPDAASRLADERLTDFERFSDLDLRHEYSLLARRWFCRLKAEEQAAILGWIEQGPDIEPYKRAVEGHTGEPVAKEQTERYANIWRRDHLALLGEGLPKEWRQRYTELVTELGPSEHPDRPFFMSTVSGVSDTIIPVDQASSMAVAELVSVLLSWKPSGDSLAPTAEDLGRQWSSIVAARPEVFAAEAWRFRGLDPAYVGGFLRGLREASKQGSKFDWSPVLDLCHWVVDQSDATEAMGVDRRERGAWLRAHEWLAHLISQGLGSGAQEIPFVFRDKVWEVLRPLTDSPNPEPADESSDHGPPPDPVVLSINTVRGEAMHAVVRYALWVRGHIDLESGREARSNRGIDETPEVRIVLERHLDQTRDPSLAIRSVYGQWFPRLVLLDPSWAAMHVADVFPMGESQRHLRDAAWEAYITMCRPDDASLSLLHNEYGRAVESLDSAAVDQSARAEPEQSLAEHLMAFYWRGKLNLEGPNELLQRFYRRAPDALRGYTLDFVGQGVGNTEGTIAPLILERLQALWAHRLNAARQASVANHSIAEMAAFGWWFASKKFDDSWALRQLKEALSIAGRVAVDHQVVGRLAELDHGMLALIVECLGLMIDGDKEGWHIHSWKKDIRRVLTSALHSGDSAAMRLANSLINRLAARGHLDFSDLLPGKQP